MNFRLPIRVQSTSVDGGHGDRAGLLSLEFQPECCNWYFGQGFAKVPDVFRVPWRGLLSTYAQLRVPNAILRVAIGFGRERCIRAVALPHGLQELGLPEVRLG